MSFLKNFFGGGGKSKTELFTPPPPPSEEAITQAESALKIKFPQSFISLLRKSRPMQLPLCAEFYWIGPEGLGMRNIIAVNRQERRESSSPLPDFLVAFYNDGMGNQVCFDKRHQIEIGEYHIVFWDHELGADENLEASEHKAKNHESAGRIAQSFPDWFEFVCPTSE